MTWPFGDIKPFSFDLIVADPPWLFRLHSADGEAKSPQAHYQCCGLDWIKALHVGHLARQHSWLFLWVTAPLLPEGLEVMKAWGFEYRSRLSWRKVTAGGKPRMGCGYIVRTLHEDVLIGALGNPKRAKPLPSLFDGVAREHSRKPDEFYTLVEKFAPDAARLDMFGRQSRPGWTVFGNESTKFDGER